MADLEDIRKLREALDDQRQHLKEDKLAFVRAEMAFHTAIAATTRNPIFEETSQAMLGWFENFHSGTLYLQGNENITLDQHEQILRAIEAKKPDNAEKAMADHLNRSSSVYRIEEEAEGE